MFEVHESKDGQFYHTLSGANGETIMPSETYTTRANAHRGVRAAQRAAREDLAEQLKAWQLKCLALEGDLERKEQELRDRDALINVLRDPVAAAVKPSSDGE